MNISYAHGVPERFRHAAAVLYDNAFGAKFAVAVPARERRLRLLAESFQLEHAIGAIADEKLVGIAGFHGTAGSLTGGMTFRSLIARLGLLRGSWAAVIFSLYDRRPLPGELLMDGIAVAPDMRGRGIGGKLLDLVTKHAREQNLKSIRLDVIDTNLGARTLYDRSGFTEIKTESFESLRWLLGFGAATTMRKVIA